MRSLSGDWLLSAKRKAGSFPRYISPHYATRTDVEWVPSKHFYTVAF
jgi:hypothetical protein